MTSRYRLVLAVCTAGAWGFFGCSSDEGAGSPPGTGGVGGVAEGTGGVAATGAMLPGTGGLDGTGAAPLGTGGVPLGTGGVPATGGNPPATGGSNPGTGGVSAGTGGVNVGTGGVNVGTGGVVAGTGGVVAGTGGVSVGTGGVSPTGGVGTGGSIPVDPNAAAAIEACMLQLPWGAPALTAEERAPIIDAIIKTCVEFAPPGAEWQQYCQMFLVAAINAESSYDVLANATGDNPAVGLMQITFTSTVVDFADYGPVDALERIGCDFGTVTDSDSFSTKREMMIDPYCNVALGAWYNFIFGSGNGGDEAVWVWAYCQGGGIAGSLHIGMACHLMGAGADIKGADFYYNQIVEWVEPCITYEGTHPFERTIEPDMGKYCR